MRIRCERLALDDADCCQHAKPIGTGEVIAFPVHKPLELIENTAIADRQHVDGDPGRIGELHRLGAGFSPAPKVAGASTGSMGERTRRSTFQRM